MSEKDLPEEGDGCDPVELVEKVINGIGYADDEQLKSWAMALRHQLRRPTAPPAVLPDSVRRDAECCQVCQGRGVHPHGFYTAIENPAGSTSASWQPETCRTCNGSGILAHPAPAVGLEVLRDKLAALAHEQWSGWMNYLFSKCTNIESAAAISSVNQMTPTRLPDAMVIPGSLVERWKRQINTPYSELSEDEKESDRQEADRTIQCFISASTPPGAQGGLTGEQRKALGACAFFLRETPFGRDRVDARAAEIAVRLIAAFPEAFGGVAT